MIYYRTLGYADVPAIVNDLTINNCTINPDEEGVSGEVKTNNIMYDDSGNYYDFTYLGHIPEEWNEDGEPITWSTEVYAHIAGKTDVSLVLTEGTDFTDRNYVNRYIGEPVPTPTQLPTMSYTKAQITEWMNMYWIPNNMAWTKEKLIDRIKEWFNINN